MTSTEAFWNVLREFRDDTFIGPIGSTLIFGFIEVEEVNCDLVFRLTGFPYF